MLNKLGVYTILTKLFVFGKVNYMSFESSGMNVNNVFEHSGTNVSLSNTELFRNMRVLNVGKICLSLEEISSSLIFFLQKNYSNDARAMNSWSRDGAESRVRFPDPASYVG